MAVEDWGIVSHWKLNEASGSRQIPTEATTSQTTTLLLASPGRSATPLSLLPQIVSH